jgi:hypothetical protein
VVNEVLRYYLEKNRDSENPLFDLIRRISHQTWFTDIFTSSLGEYWLSDIVLDVPSTHLDGISQILIDQIVFSRTLHGVRFWLKCIHMCLQSFGLRWPTESTYLMDEHASRFLTCLYTTVLWLFKMSSNTRTPSPTIIHTHRASEHLPPATPTCWYCRGFNRPCRTGPDSLPQDFGFVSTLTERHWTKLITDLKVVLMGTQLGGLGVSSTMHSHRFTRDPDGACSHVYQRKGM